MRNIIKNVAAKNAVPWGEIAEKIDENFSEVEANFVKGIKVDGHTITRKDENGVIDIGNLTDIYIIPDFTIEDLENLSGTNPVLYLNTRALNSALDAGKAIGIRQGNSESMSIASAFRETDDPIIHLTVISGDGTMYKTLIDCGPAEEPDVVDSESGRILFSWLQVTPVSDVYIVTEFAVDDVISQPTATKPKLTISRAFLDAAYRGIPIMVKGVNSYLGSIPIKVERIANPDESTSTCFRLQFENIEYEVSCSSSEVLIGAKSVDVEISSYNLIDWNENDVSNPGYIANRTHYIKHKTIDVSIGDSVSLVSIKGTHYLGNYKVLYGGELYDIPPSMATRQTIDISGYFRLQFAGYSESGKMSTFTFLSSILSSEAPYKTFAICGDFEGSGHKVLDEFYLPDGAKPWKLIDPTSHITSGICTFKDVSTANIADGDNVLRDKAIYKVGNNYVSIHLDISTLPLEFKLIAGPKALIDFNGEYIWENGARPDTTKALEVIYSVLVLDGKAYVSAKVYNIAK